MTSNPILSTTPTPMPVQPRTSRALTLVRDFALVPALVLAVIVGALVNPAFLSPSNLTNILQQSAELLLVVIGLTLILLVGRIDLSLESTFGLAPMVAGLLVIGTVGGGLGVELNGFVGILIALLVGALVGTLNGTLVVYTRLNAFVVTLAMLILLRGIVLGLGGGRTLFALPPEFAYLGSGKVFGVPVSVIIAGAVFAVAWLLLSRHRLGRALYAVGGNSGAARAAGVRVDLVIWSVFIIAGMLAALAGVIQAGRLGAITAIQGQNLIFTAFASAVIGGISLNGGRGSIFGALTGVLFLGVVSNILVLAQIPSFWIDASYGLIILVALIISRYTSGKPQEL